MDDLYWRNMLKFKLRRIPLDERRRWTHEQLVRWYLGLPEHTDVRGVARIVLPPFSTIKRLCEDLVGASARD